VQPTISSRYLLIVEQSKSKTCRSLRYALRSLNVFINRRFNDRSLQQERKICGSEKNWNQTITLQRRGTWMTATQ
ncbi:hypothetical protein CHS0354_021066, partial [Potamilus streckersoni]